ARFTPARSDGSRFRTAASFASSEGYQGRSPWLSEFFDQLRARLSLPARGIDSLAVVVWWMMWQRLDGRGSLATAVQQVVQGALGDLVPPEKRVVEKRVSSHTGALSRARTRLPLEAAEAVCDQVFATLIQSAQAHGDLLSRLFLVDGSSMRLPHTPALEKAYPPGGNQHGKRPGR